MKQFSAVIFDMDGVISDTQKLHSSVESDILKEYDVHMSPEEITEKYAGVKIFDLFSELLGHTNADIPTLVEKKRAHMLSLAQESVDPIEGSQEFIRSLRNQEYKLAVASASHLPYIFAVLESLDVKDHFGAIASAQEVKHGKPEPDVFLLAAERLGVEPQKCAVIEDGISGMIAANKAGMYSIGLVPEVDTKKYPAQKLVRSFSELSEFFT